MLRHAGVTESEIGCAKERLEKLGLVRAAAELDDALTRKVTIAGTPDQVVEGLRRFRDSGLKLPIVWEIIGPNRLGSLRLIAREVMPKLF